jgi:hypothetical protein
VEVNRAVPPHSSIYLLTIYLQPAQLRKSKLKLLSLSSSSYCANRHSRHYFRITCILNSAISVTPNARSAATPRLPQTKPIITGCSAIRLPMLIKDGRSGCLQRGIRIWRDGVRLCGEGSGSLNPYRIIPFASLPPRD